MKNRFALPNQVHGRPEHRLRQLARIHPGHPTDTRMISFDHASLQKLFVPATNSNGEDNGQVTIIGGSSLFHGAPLLSLTTASRFVDMVFFTSPEPSIGKIAEEIKSRLSAFIWVPFAEVEDYIAKSDAVLIGPGLMRYSQKEKDGAYQKSRQMTYDLLIKFPQKKWVIDAGSLQTMDPDWIPNGAILTPNLKEYELLFGKESPEAIAQKYHCLIVLKGPVTHVYLPTETIEIKGGNPGLTKGGTGDVQAGLTVALFAKNEAELAASAAAFLVKTAGDDLYQKVGVNFNADDLTQAIPQALHNLLGQ